MWTHKSHSLIWLLLYDIHMESLDLSNMQMQMNVQSAISAHDQATPN